MVRHSCATDSTDVKGCCASCIMGTVSSHTLWDLVRMFNQVCFDHMTALVPH